MTRYAMGGPVSPPTGPDYIPVSFGCHWLPDQGLTLQVITRWIRALDVEIARDRRVSRMHRNYHRRRR